MTEAIATHDVAVRARDNNVVACVAAAVIDAIATKLFACAAIAAAAWEHHCQQEHLVDVVVVSFALVDGLVSLLQEKGASLRRFGVPAGGSHAPCALFWRETTPSLRTSITALLSRAMARTALVGQAVRAALVAEEKVAVQRQVLPAPMASACFPHALSVAGAPPKRNDGPHYGVLA